MKLTIFSDDLRRAASIARHVSDPKSSLPLLTTARLCASVEDGAISISATNLEVAVQIPLHGYVERSGEVLLDARKLAELTAALPEGNLAVGRVAVERDGDGPVTIGRDKVVFKVACPLDPADFPRLISARPSQIMMPAEELVRLIRSVRFAASQDEGRYFLQGVYLDLMPPNTIRAVATDSRRLALCEYSSTGLAARIEERTGVIVPSYGADEIVRMFRAVDDSVSIGIHDNHLVVSGEPGTLSIRLIDGEFPIYEQIMPKDNPIHLRVNREALMTAVRRVGLFADPETLTVCLDVGETSVKLSAQSISYGESYEEIDAICDTPIQIGFCGKYLVQALEVLDAEDVIIEMKGPLDAVVVLPHTEVQDTRSLVMPMKLV